ncbi:MAG TPA: energy transducer TonB [Candidatus Eisenbacteria bacterium]|nr:energy transducer TonB [Candidatus Eisenbacteria bacterium]
MSEVTATQPQKDDAFHNAPALHYELEPRPRVFWRNLTDLILRREPAPVETTAEPVPIPPEKWIATGLGPQHYVESYGYHALLVVLIYFFSTSSWFSRPVQLQSPFENTQVEHYALSEYLPPINTGPRGEAKPRKGAPKLAKQEILSVPPNPDNNHQTIVTPPNIKLNHDVPLPNIVAWTNIPGQPIAASQRPISQLKLPQFAPQVVEPTADVSKLQSRNRLTVMAQPTVVEPTADVSHVKPKLTMPALAQPSVIEPPLAPDQLKLRRGEINMAQIDPQVAPPKLPVQPQRAGAVGDAAAGESAGKNVPAQPSIQGLQPSKGQGQIIALSLNPADVRGPIEVPGGNRSGEFHASPGGKPDAPGTPNVAGTPGATGSGAGGGKGNGSGSGGNGNAPPGISVGAAPPGAAAAAVTGTPGKSPGDTQAEANRKLIAAAMRPSIPSVSRPPVEPPPPTMSDTDADAVERQVFGTKKYYSLVLNMPNLTSATGSWIVRFAELKQSDSKAALAAPVALSKVDPAYPADALRDNVEGTVTLYAVIHADGTVSGIKVLNSVDPRLDAAAARALSHWVFRPGTKAGDPVELEAVVQIPFRKRHVR